jgi:hypothetical protein
MTGQPNQIQRDALMAQRRKLEDDRRKNRDKIERLQGAQIDLGVRIDEIDSALEGLNS